MDNGDMFLPNFRSRGILADAIGARAQVLVHAKIVKLRKFDIVLGKRTNFAWYSPSIHMTRKR